MHVENKRKQYMYGLGRITGTLIKGISCKD